MYSRLAVIKFLRGCADRCMGIDDIGREENASFFNIFGHVPRLSFSLFAKYYVTVGKISTGGFAFHPEGQEKCSEKPFF